MQRVPEPELMDDPQQVEAYAQADFSDGDRRTLALIETLLARTPALPQAPLFIDLGCGPGNITLPLALSHPTAQLVGVDGAESMLAVAAQRSSAQGLTVRWRHVSLQDLQRGDLPELIGRADLIVSNSLLHHLHQPALLWTLTRLLAAPGCRVLHRDLRRPASLTEARQLQKRHLPGGPEMLVRDFLASLQAAFEVPEVEAQLRAAGLGGLSVCAEDDRYLVVSGLVD
jgi:2-polyprenyl-3-methyl-5-hydroxy-6-metoxy-1,4-benzoquinol methylase